jgi:uncharacterized protein YndB with AHSA1/START domain
MPVIERFANIAATPDEVWRYLADIPGQPRWMRDLKSLTIETPGEVRVGTRAVGTVRMFGVTQTDPIEITAFEAPRHFGLRHLGGFTGTGDFWLSPTNEGRSTRVRWREELRPDPAGLGVPRLLRPAANALVAVFDPLTVPVFDYVFRTDLRRLKRLAENDPD